MYICTYLCSYGISGFNHYLTYALQEINCTCLRVFMPLETVEISKCQLINLLLDIDFDKVLENDLI